MKNQIGRITAEVVKDEMVMRDKILSHLDEGPKTIPEMADALGHPGNEVMIWIMTMWRYGQIEEIGKPDEDGYHHYRRVK